MISVALQTLAAIVAGWALFRLARASMPVPRRLRHVVVAAFLGRALLGQALFWISWLHLPLMPGLQRGNGIWFFALDGEQYSREAAAAAMQGLGAILHLTSSTATIYVQLLASTMWLFGAVTSSALLLNLFCYLGMVALLVRWSRRQPGAQTAAAVSIVAISASPAFVLWSLQPLKDIPFQLLFVVFFCACAAWQRAWLEPSPPARAVVGALLLLAALTMLSGLRWYFGFAAFAAMLPFLFLTALRARDLKSVSFGSALLLAFLLALAVVGGGGAHAPRRVVALITPSSALATAADAPAVLADSVRAARGDFERAGGQTLIQPPAAELPLRSEIVAIPILPTQRAAEEQEIRAVIDRFAAAWNRHDAAAIADTFETSDSVEIRAAGDPRVFRGRAAVADFYRVAVSTAHDQRITFTDLRIDAAPRGTAMVFGRWQLGQGRSATRGGVGFLLARTEEGWRIVRQLSTDDAPPSFAELGADARVTMRPAQARRTTPAPPPPSQRARSLHAARLLSGAATFLVPATNGNALGLFQVGGGRGLLWLTDIDTLLFDGALIFAIAVIAKRFAASSRDPLVWFTVTLTLLIGAPLAYVVANFGTLFRLREMVWLGVILAPVAAASAAARNGDAPAPR